MSMKIINPKKWQKPVGYSNAIKTDGGNTVYLGGQVAFDSDLKVIGKGDLVAQFEQVMKNLATVMEEAGGSLRDIVKLTIFVKDRDDYIKHGKAIGSSYRWHFGDHYPAMTLVEISRFYEEGVLLEIEGIAVF
ncbi:MAG: enamine deaminase RidA (YjgF/YER057c/UK114 family) [Planctomycetota bacterium]|jgi:enamine deaminase RidA (YjgF/YER057c/UK114 family)